MRKTPENVKKRIGQLAKDGKSAVEIARIIGLSIPTVRTILAETFEIMPELRAAIESIGVPWKFKKMALGEEEIVGTKANLLAAIDIAKKLNDVLFTQQFNRRWVVIVSKEMNIVSIKRVN